jgi:hypothetical protein
MHRLSDRSLILGMIGRGVPRRTSRWQYAVGVILAHERRA